MRKNWVVFFSFWLVLSACGNLKEIEPPYELGSDPLNAAQFGFVLEEEGWLYYHDGTENNNISRTDGVTKETYENTYGRGIQSQGDYIYYASFGEKTGLFRFRKEDDGVREQIIETYISDYIIVNDFIFYSTNYDQDSGIYRVSLDGEEKVQLEEGMINHMQWADGWIYYAIPAGGAVFRMNTVGKEKTQLKTDQDINISTTNFIVAHEWIYFENRDDNFSSFHPTDNQNDNIYQMKVDGTNVQAIGNGWIHNYLQEDRNLIFSTAEIEELMIMERDGTNQNVLYDGDKRWSWVNVINEELYLIDWDPEGDTKVYLYDGVSKELIEKEY